MVVAYMVIQLICKDSVNTILYTSQYLQKQILLLYVTILAKTTGPLAINIARFNACMFIQLNTSPLYISICVLPYT